jgi:alkylated DNA nucleotide flippase Atl1
MPNRRTTWHEIASALGELRAQLNDHATQSVADAARVDGVDRAARTVCKVLQATSARFDARRFMRVFNRNKTLR